MKKSDEMVVYVTWVDPFSVDEWSSRDDLPMKPCYIRSVGFLVNENKSCIAIAPNVGDERIDKEVSCTTIIPKKCIVSMHCVRKTIVKNYEFDDY